MTAKRWGERLPAWGAVFTMLVVAVGYAFALKDAPAAHAEVRMHHDTLVAVTEAQAVIAKHLEVEDSIRTETDRKLDYLVCLRIERRREIAGEPPLVDCDAGLLTGDFGR